MDFRFAPGSNDPLLGASVGGSFDTSAEGADASVRGPIGSIAETIRKKHALPKQFFQKHLARLRQVGVSDNLIAAAAARCKTTGASLLDELALNGQLNLSAYFRIMAEDLRLPFVETIEPGRILADLSRPQFRQGRSVFLHCIGENGAVVLCVAPDLRTETQLADMFAEKPELRSRFCISEPQTIIGALEEKSARKCVEASVSELHEKWPHLSAKQTMVSWQAYVIGVASAIFPICLSLAFWQTLLAVHVFSILLFGLGVAVRMAAWLKMEPTSKSDLPIKNGQTGLPFYSVMIALHKEVAVVPQLVRAMARLDWPLSRLEVLYVCEADDSGTLNALEQFRLPASHRIIRVPPALPRTKPKALNYALARCAGDFVVIYDAEDRPHPSQLKEAWAKFKSAPENLACLQAPLDIANAEQATLAKMFAFEYAAHFHGLLPYLAKSSIPLPLGGTSNHFRRKALIECMAWDPYNVTEDADLGIRLYRLGYRCDVLTLHTLEDAPTRLKQWSHNGPDGSRVGCRLISCTQGILLRSIVISVPLIVLFSRY